MTLKRQVQELCKDNEFIEAVRLIESQIPNMGYREKKIKVLLGEYKSTRLLSNTFN